VISGANDQHTTAGKTHEVFSVANDPTELWFVDGAAHEDLHQISVHDYREQACRFFNR
jgi:uncharacterized protein